MSTPTLREIIGAMAAGAVIRGDDQNCYALCPPSPSIPYDLLTQTLIRDGWVESTSNAGGYRLTDAGLLAYMRSTDELGTGELIAPRKVKREH